MILKHSDRLRELGGPGSGNWGHLGIPGYRGGSQAGSGGIHARPDNYKDKKGGEKKEDKKDDIEPGRVPGVEYTREPYPRSPGYGISHPLVSPEGIDLMATDFKKIETEKGVKTKLADATKETKNTLVKQLNGKQPEARYKTLKMMSEQYLKMKGKEPDAESIETQLNKWKLSAIPKNYSPKGK